MNKVWIADLQILGSAFFFGIGFIGQRAVSVEGMGPMTCNALRFALSAFLLVVAMPFLPQNFFSGGEMTHSPDDKEKGNDDNDDENMPLTSSGHYGSGNSNDSTNAFCRFLSSLTPLSSPANQKSVLYWGIFLGCVNFLGSGLQQVGITMTSANKVAFIAGFDLFLTPIFSLFIPTFKRNGKPSPSVWLAVCISIFGLYLLSNATLAELTMIGGHGEIICLISTVFWTLHITYTDIATSYVDCLHMMCVQLSIVAIISAFAAMMFEQQVWVWQHIWSFFPWMLFLAIVEGLGFTLMAMGQHFSPPTHAAILLSLEGVFASVASYFVLSETLCYKELMGCVLMLTATMIAKLGFFHLDFAVAEAEKNMINSLHNSNTVNNNSNANSLISVLETGSFVKDKDVSALNTSNTLNVSCAMRVKACVTIPAIMLRESIANFRVTVSQWVAVSQWLGTQVRHLMRQTNAASAAGTSMNNIAQSNSSNSVHLHSPKGTSTYSSHNTPHTTTRDQHSPLIARELKI